MNETERKNEERIKTVKSGGILLTIYSICALTFFALIYFGIIDIINIGGDETARLTTLSTIGVCALGAFTGVICLIKIKDPKWHGYLYIFCVITVIFSAFVQLNYASASGNFIGFLIMPGCIVFAFICGYPLYKLKSDIADEDDY